MDVRQQIALRPFLKTWTDLPTNEVLMNNELRTVCISVISKMIIVCTVLEIKTFLRHMYFKVRWNLVGLLSLLIKLIEFEGFE